MMRKLNKADLWLINEIRAELQEEYLITPEKADACIKNSNLLLMLDRNPKFVHHEDSNSWVRTIANQNDLRALAY